MNTEFITTRSLRDLKADKTDVNANNAKIVKNKSAIGALKTKKVDKFDFGVEVIKLTQEYKDSVSKSHITSSSHLKDEFRYLMEDVDESISMHDITVTGINDSPKSPHLFNKNAYDLQIYKIATCTLGDLVLTCINFQEANTPFASNSSQ